MIMRVLFVLLLKRVLNFRILQEQAWVSNWTWGFIPFHWLFLWLTSVTERNFFTSNLNYSPLYKACLFNLHLPPSSSAAAPTAAALLSPYHHLVVIIIISSQSTSASTSSIPATAALKNSRCLLSVAITYWLTFIAFIKNHNFHQSNRHKNIIDMANSNTNSIIICGKRATSIKYVNSMNNCWLKPVLNKAQWKKTWKYFVM